MQERLLRLLQRIGIKRIRARKTIRTFTCALNQMRNGFIIKKMLQQGARPDAVDGNGKRAIDVFNETLQEPWAQKAAGQTDRTVLWCNGST